MKKIICFISVFIFCISIDLFSQNNMYILDLAETTIEEGQIINVNAKTNFQVLLTNLVPKNEYVYQYSIYCDSIPPLPSFHKKSNNPGNYECKVITDKLIVIINKIENLTKEKEIKEYKDEFEKQIINIQNDSCSSEDLIKEKLKYAHLLLSRTEKSIPKTFKLNTGEKLELIITRKDNNSKWIYVFNAGKRGIWLTSYGFTFVSNILKQQKEFIVKKITNDSNIVSTFTPVGSEFELAPSIFYTWLPGAKESDNWVYGLSGGLGFNLESPVVMLGFSITYNWNLNVMVGVAGHIIKKPSESYTESQKITASDVESLNRRTAVFDPFIAFTFRFDSNPFSK
ncbi:MAG: hypothetical protein NTU73_12740 [Ignavibacteriae bacterium]|nr:hypothetical protein [Ignavibacteriota bacterium]